MQLFISAWSLATSHITELVITEEAMQLLLYTDIRGLVPVTRNAILHTFVPLVSLFCLFLFVLSFLKEKMCNYIVSERNYIFSKYRASANSSSRNDRFPLQLSAARCIFLPCSLKQDVVAAAIPGSLHSQCLPATIAAGCTQIDVDNRCAGISEKLWPIAPSY